MFSISFQLNRSIVVNKPVEQVFSTLADFTSWPAWSPWIIQEPDCPVSSLGEPESIGHQQEWNGKRIGSGRIVLSEIVSNQKLGYDLYFLAPWKSQCTTQFEFTAITDKDGNETTEVTWLMQGTLPFFLFFMKKMMVAMVGSDYERGLKMFKEYAETGQVNSSVEINDTQLKTRFYYVGYPVNCNLSEISNVIRPTFEKLESSDIPKPDMYLTVINKFDFISKDANMVAAVAYKSKPDFNFDQEMVEGEMPPHKTQSVTHTGSYYHLANGWATVMNYLRFAKQKQNKKVKEYEVYLNMPSDTEESELKTEIFIPIK